jgi:hypothetical protein
MAREEKKKNSIHEKKNLSLLSDFLSTFFLVSVSKDQWTSEVEAAWKLIELLISRRFVEKWNEEKVFGLWIWESLAKVKIAFFFRTKEMFVYLLSLFATNSIK